RRGPARHAVPSNTQTVRRLLPAAARRPMTNRLAPATAAADSSSAAGSDVSTRWVGIGEGEGTAEREGEGEGAGTEGVGVADACCGPAHESKGSRPKIETARNRPT